ncbi:CBS domain-containing protein [Candidatus Woesearchaeota archaeon]|nr:CBS domain-containing protein [Candidatus Woesearchaeota archaeon]
MTLVKDLMQTPPVTLTKGTPVAMAAHMMKEKGIGFIVIVENPSDKRLVGVVSDTDFVRKVLHDKLDPEKVKVDDVMSTLVRTTSPDTELVDAIEVVCKERLKRLPVIQDGQVVGILSITDVIPLFLDYKKKLLDLALGF